MPKIDIGKVLVDASSLYPAQFRKVVDGRQRQRLGNAAGLTQFGVNLTRLKPGAASALRHWHENEDEFIYVVEGEITLVTDAGRQKLGPGMAAGFPAGKADGHQLVNETDKPVLYREIGDRTPGESASYPDDDLAMHSVDGKFVFTHKDGSPFK